MRLNLKRKAFSMVTAIVVIVLMATVAVLILNISGKIVKETTAQFQREQSMLLAKSYTEYAIMAVMSNNRTGTNTCLNRIDGDVKIDDSSAITVANGNGYRVRVFISYIGSATEVVAACTNVLSASVTTVDTPLNFVIDTYVDYKDPDNTAGSWIAYHKRTLQKI